MQLDLTGDPMRVRWLEALRLICAVLLLAGLGGRVTIVSLFGFVGIGILFHTARPQGNDGSDQMLLIVASALLVGRASATLGGPICLRATIFFIAGQATLSYVTSGWAKVIAPGWRNGRQLPEILATRSYGVSWAARSVRWSPIARASSWAVIFLEAAFPLIFVSPPNVVYAWLVALGLFHLSVALIMRLNGFVFAFVGTFPAIASVAGAWLSVPAFLESQE